MIAATRTRIVKATTGTLSWQPTGPDGEPADPGTVTVGVTRSDGTDVIASGTATSGATTAPRTVAHTVAHTATCDVLTATWTVSGVAVATTAYEIVGGVYFFTAELRAHEPMLRDPATVTTAQLIAVRTEVETAFESWTNLAMVPRFEVVTVNEWNDYSLQTGRYFPRSVRWARVWSSGSTYTDLSSSELLEVWTTEDGCVRRTAGWSGYRVQVGLEYGMDKPAPDAKRMALIYARICAVRATKGVSGAAASYTTPEGQTVSYEPDLRPTSYRVINEFLTRRQVNLNGPWLA